MGVLNVFPRLRDRFLNVAKCEQHIRFIQPTSTTYLHTSSLCFNSFMIIIQSCGIAFAIDTLQSILVQDCIRIFVHSVASPTSGMTSRAIQWTVALAQLELPNHWKMVATQPIAVVQPDGAATKRPPTKPMDKNDDYEAELAVRRNGPIHVNRFFYREIVWFCACV